MTTKNADPTLPVLPDNSAEPARGACVEFVKFCKEQHLNARAAKTFLRLLQNKPWDHECEKIRESMRPEVDRLFEPAEKALLEGKNCREVLDLLVKTLHEAENL
ncbi:MAG: hypothetical protein P4M01_05300 [Acidobacteriota bacterium]|nr:hypothetical protein [Acidobacteriota bacterium]